MDRRGITEAEHVGDGGILNLDFRLCEFLVPHAPPVISSSKTHSRRDVSQPATVECHARCPVLLDRGRRDPNRLGQHRDPAESIQYHRAALTSRLLCRQTDLLFAEALILEEARTDTENRGYSLPGDMTKNRVDVFVPVPPPQAMMLLVWPCARTRGLEQSHLIRYRAADGSFHPMQRLKADWRTTLAELELAQHTYRHTRASFSAAFGRVAPRKTVQSLSRHQDRA